MENYFEENDEFTYLRFPIGVSYSSPFDMKTNTGSNMCRFKTKFSVDGLKDWHFIVRYFNIFFDFVEKVMDEGKNVLIHCCWGILPRRRAKGVRRS